MTARQRLAQLISNFANPALLLLISSGFVIDRYTNSNVDFWRFFLLVNLVLLGPGSVYVIGTWIKEGKIDLDVTNRRDRVIPLLLTTLGAILGAYLVETRLDNQTLLAMSRALAAVLLVLTAVTLAWKISLHAATITALVTLVVLFRQEQLAVLYLLIIPVFWARLELKQHTFPQLASGAIAGFMITYLVMVFFRG